MADVLAHRHLQMPTPPLAPARAAGNKGAMEPYPAPPLPTPPPIAPGLTYIVGVDEAGRGPLAGPVVAGAVILPVEGIAGLADSKVLSARRRAVLEETIKAHCLWAVGVVEVEEIDRINIFAATMKAMTLAVGNLTEQMGRAGLEGGPFQDRLRVLVDGNMTPQGRVREWCWPVRAIVGGDAIEPAISAASIIAKEHRDRLMRALAEAHPGYGWERNAGYGTREHMAALARLGPTPHHRRSFAPVAQAALLF